MPIPELQISQTPCGVRFATRSGYPHRPMPTVFVFAKSMEESLTEDDYFESGRALLGHGFCCVSLDLPCHGADAREDEPFGLDGWRARLEKGESFLPQFLERCSRVLGHLIEQGIADPHRIAASGTSRGGFTALHLAAVDARFKSIVAFAPVVDLAPVPGFGGMDGCRSMRAIALENIVPQLAGKSIWITIGNADWVVDTDLVIRFARQVAAAHDGPGPADIELQVVPTPGHTTPAGAHQTAVNWLLQRVGNIAKG